MIDPVPWADLPAPDLDSARFSDSQSGVGRELSPLAMGKFVNTQLVYKKV